MKTARMLRIVGVAVGLVLAATAGQAGADTHYVSAGQSIQAALDDPCTADGDEIEVGPGTYYEAIDFNDKAVRLYSSGGADVTTIDGTGNYHVVQCVSGEDANTILEGFTITGGNATGTGEPNDRGGGMYNYLSSPTVTDCNFTGNTADWGGGMYNDGSGSSPTVSNCIFSGNEATTQDGGGMGNTYANPTVTNCVFTNNSAYDTGGAMANGYNSPTVTNCTFNQNVANGANGGGGMRNWSSNPTVTNCILWGNTPDEISSGGTSDPNVTYSDIEGSYTGNGNINLDPLFVDAGGGDLRLVSSASPCVDNGNNGAVTEPNDVAGNPRVVDGDLDSTATVDMGAYELQSKDIHNITQDAYYETIQAAIDDANDVDEIEVASGTYNEAINFGGKGITLRSTDRNDPNVVAATIIDATGLGSSVVTCDSGEGPNTILEGFTITGGSASNGGGMYNNNSSPTVTNCVFSGNVVHSDLPTGGGGMCNKDNSSPTVTNCVFSGNSGDWFGGGMYNSSSSPTVTNCTFSGNTSDYGGGMCNYDSSNPTVTNCILWSNSPDEIYNNSSSPTVSYSDVEGGTGQGWFGTGCIDADPFFVDDGNADPNLWNLRLAYGSACIDAGDNNSVPADTADLDGDGNTTEPIPFDLDGGPRVAFGVVDMGAYEYWTVYAYDPNPADGAEVVTKTPTLTWKSGVWADQHEVYFGTDETAVANADNTDTTGIYQTTRDANNYTPPGPLVLGETYYWKITEVNTGYVGPLTPPWEGDVWSFRVEGHAHSPSPGDGDVNVPFLGLELSWTAGAEAESHMVYFGTDFDSVNDANTTVPLGVYIWSLGPNSYDLGPLVVPDTRYYWRVDEVNESAGTFLKGDVWRFTAGEFLIADDFESYADDWELLAVWDDYWVNGSDGIIWLENHPNIIREPNSQAAKLEFANMTPSGPGYIGSWFDVQDLTELDIGSDWTIGGVKALTLYMRGDPCNVNVLPGGPSAPELAAGRPWVELEDTSYWADYVLYPDANDILEDIWHEWNIDLGIFGVTLSEIDRFTIGIGGYDKTGASGEMSYYGRIWVDDIRVYVPRCLPEYATASLDNDCITDFEDIRIMAEQWLTSGPEADIVDDDIVNFEDYGILGDNWLEEFLWPPG